MWQKLAIVVGHTRRNIFFFLSLPFSFGLVPGAALAVAAPLMPNQSYNTILPINTGGPVMKMTPLTMLQVAVKNNIDVLYFSAIVPMHVFYSEDGQMGECIEASTCRSLSD